MRRIFGVFLLALVSCSVSTPPIDAPKEFIPPIPKEFTLSNGLKVLFLENNELPVVDGALYIPGGALWEKKRAAIPAMGSLLRGGGTEKLPPRDIDRRLQELSATISSAFGDEFGTVNFSSLKDDTPEVIGLLSDIIRTPRFDEGRFEVYKRQAIESIRRRKDDPDTIARLTLTQVLFQGSAFSEVATSLDVTRLTRDDLVSAYREVVSPQDAVMVVTGDVAEGVLRELLEKNFGEWKSRGPVKELTPPVVASYPKPGIYFIEQPLQQATIVASQLSLPRGHPDRFKVELLNNIFGFGGFGSRLMQEVRTRSGLSYSVYAGTLPGLVFGQNILGMQTKSESAGLAINKSLDVLAGLQTALVTDDELNENKEGLLNSFIFRFETSATTLNRMATQMMLRVPRDFDRKYLTSVPTVTPEEVREMANKWWKASELVFVVVGPKTALKAIQKDAPSSIRKLPVFEGKFDEVFSRKQ